jgi:hypothetical protein
VRKGRMEERASDSAGAGEGAESGVVESAVEAEGDRVLEGGAVGVVGSEEPVVGEETAPAVAMPGTQCGEREARALKIWSCWESLRLRRETRRRRS